MSNQLRVAELDFDTIKSNLREFLRNKPEFTDYDFEGSGLSILIDLLAYNTHYNAVIGNMLAQELFLDTAVKRQSIALIAKRLGYLPISYRSPKAIVDVEVFPLDDPGLITIGKNAKFTATLTNFDNATFVTRDARTISKDTEGRYIFRDLELYEGDNAVFKYVVTNSVVQQFEIPTEFVDTTLIRVYVQESIGSTQVEEWTNFNTLVDLNSETKAYFVKLNENLRYEVYFGDDVFGKSVVPGNIVIIDYVATNGPAANSANRFQLADNISGYTNILTTTKVPAYGGSFPESNDSIRVNAQRTVLMQNRAVTESDYVAIVQQILPVETIAVYGGETLSPPQYGKVFISIKQPGITTPLTSQQKTNILLELQKRAVLSLIHEFVDPTYVYVGITTQVKYDPGKTTATPGTFNTQVINTIRQFGITNLNKFNASFDYSRLVATIDNSDRAITSNDTYVTLRREIDFIHGIDNKYRYDFNTAIKQSNSKEDNITSSPFILYDYPDNVAYLDDVDGVVRAYYRLNDQKITLIENVGYVDYAKGIIDVNLTTVAGTYQKLMITVVPSNRNFIPGRNNILTILDADIKTSITNV